MWIIPLYFLLKSQSFYSTDNSGGSSLGNGLFKGRFNKETQFKVYQTHSLFCILLLLISIFILANRQLFFLWWDYYLTED